MINSKFNFIIISYYMFYDNSIYHGGKLLAKGSFGCVYKPPLKCKNADTRLSGYVSKLMLNKDARNEIQEQKQVDIIDPKYHFHLKIGNECVPAKPDLRNDDNLKDCVLHKKKLNSIYNKKELQKNYLIVHIEDGGVGLDDYLDDPNNVSSVEKCELMFYDFTRIMHGLNEFSKNNMGHFDIKTANIVYKKETNRFNFIDFGFTSEYSDFLTDHIDWGTSYWVNPLERSILDIDNYEVKNSFFEPLFELSRSKYSLNELKNNSTPLKHVFNYLKSNFKKYLVRYRNVFRDYITEIREDVYGPYGLNKERLPSDDMIVDYISYTRDLLKKGMRVKEIKIKIRDAILHNIDTFSVSLVMIEMLGLMTFFKTINDGVVLNYGGEKKENIKFSQSMNSISPFFRSFYELMLQMNVPSFPKRVSTQEALDIYIKTVYEPIKRKYGLADLEFLKNDNAISPINLVLSSSSTKTPPKKTLKKKIKIKRRKDENEKTRVSKKECSKTQIRNPLTGRCISTTGVTAKNLKKRNIIRSSTSSPIKKKTIKIKKRCKDHQVLNPKTNRCVKKDGAVAKKLKLV